jgi:hypothetical protein
VGAQHTARPCPALTIVDERYRSLSGQIPSSPSLQRCKNNNQSNTTSSTCYLVQISFAYYFPLSQDRTVENTCSYQSSRLRPCAAGCGLMLAVRPQRRRSSCFSRSLVAPCSAIVARIPESSLAIVLHGPLSSQNID